MSLIYYIVEDKQSRRSLGAKISSVDPTLSSKPSKKTNIQVESTPGGEKPKNEKVDEQNQPRQSPRTSQEEKQPPRSILASATGTDAEKGKTQAKSVVMNTTPKGVGVTKDSGKNKPPGKNKK